MIAAEIATSRILIAVLLTVPSRVMTWLLSAEARFLEVSANTLSLSAGFEVLIIMFLPKIRDNTNVYINVMKLFLIDSDKLAKFQCIKSLFKSKAVFAITLLCI